MMERITDCIINYCRTMMIINEKVQFHRSGFNTEWVHKDIQHKSADRWRADRCYLWEDDFGPHPTERKFKIKML